MKYLLGLLLTVACVTAMRYEPPKPKVPAVRATMRTAGPLLWVKWVVAANPSDSLTVDVSATGNASLHRMYVADSKTDSVSYPKPAPGAAITVTLLAKNWRNTRNAAAPLAQGTYTEPDTTVTPPSVQFQITPASGTVTTGGQVQFTVKAS